MAIEDWKLALRTFTLGTFTVWIYGLLSLTGWTDFPTYCDSLECYFSVGPLLCHFTLFAVVSCVVPLSKYDIVWRSYILGTIFNIGFSLVIFTNLYKTFGCYMMFVSFFHWSEFITQSIFNPETTTSTSFMLYHSNAYIIAALASIFEYWVEMVYMPSWKNYWGFAIVGFTMCVFGEALRKVSMWTAKSNFNHHVQYRKADEHELVTWGVYSWSRHPSYVGWYCWSVGTQILLLNPICIVAYMAASWMFFNERIYEEEQTLISFFGEKYIDYQKRVGILIPFIKGFTIEEWDDSYKATS